MRVDGTPPISVALLKVWTGSLDPKSLSQNAVTAPGIEARKTDPVAPVSLRSPVAPTPPMAGRLRISFDETAGLFVQTLTDPATNEVLRQYPNDTQLHFARAVQAYVEAKFAGR